MTKNKHQYIIGVSGGPDSMCLVDKYKKSIKAVCHINYHMRQSAKRDEAIVKNYCKLNQLNYFVKNCFFTKTSQHNNFQDWARKKRYDFMIEIAKQFNCNMLLVGHHLNDVIETALMQVKRKSKTLFLGISKFSNYKGFKIYRPLLTKTKAELIAYCDNKKLEYGIDETNYDPKYLRNQLRLEIAQWSKTKFELFHEKIIKFNQQNQNLKKQAERFYQHWKTTKNTKNLLTKPENFIFHVLYLLLLSYEINPNEQKLAMIIVLMKKNNPTKWFRLGNGLFLSCKNQKLIIKQRKN